MKSSFRRLAALSLTAAMCFTGSYTMPAYAEDAASGSVIKTMEGAGYEDGSCGLYDYYVFNDADGTIEAQITEDGGFDFVWNDLYYGYCSVGKNYSKEEPVPAGTVVEYKADAGEDSKYMIGVESFFTFGEYLVIDFVIIDDWGGVEREDLIQADNPTTKFIATVEADGAEYDIYRKNVTGFVDGTGQNVVKVESIRREKTSDENGVSSGRISVDKHFSAYNKPGEKLDTPLSVMLMAEAWGSSGSVKVMKNDISCIKGVEKMQIRPGDANCDGEVNMADAVFIMQVISDPDKYHFTADGEKNADIDGSGDVTNKDALIIQQYKLGIIDKI